MIRQPSSERDRWTEGKGVYHSEASGPLMRRRAICERVRHAIGAPDSIRELSEFCFHRLVDGSAPNDEVLYLHQALTLLRYLEGVVDLERDEGEEVWNVECGRWEVECGRWKVESGRWEAERRAGVERG